MTRSELNNRYFEWMYRLVYNENRFKRSTYRKLLIHLHTIDFYYTIGMDGNRAEDGVGLRYRFGYEFEYADSMIAEYLDNRCCSVLEMMIALAIRCEENIMSDREAGDRTEKWFWDMIANLGLTGMTDREYIKSYVDHVISKFLNREYKENGEGGLFTVKHSKNDFRTAEIWYQMCWHLDELLYD